MRFSRSRLPGPAAALILVLLSCACVVAVDEGRSGPVRVPPPPPAPPHHPPIDDDYGLFYDRLEPYGAWAWMDPYGWVWSPWNVAAGWRPYNDGRWIYTNDGWYWESAEVWGWATYHYGRWTFHPRFGWIWIPGREWAPAWVAWRHGEGWIGWAPLPPQAVWRVGVGLDLGGVDIDVIVQPFWWGFVEERVIFEPRIGVRVVPYARNVTLVRRTRHVTHYTIVQSRVVVHGVDVDDYERRERKKVPRYRIVDDDRDEVRGGTMMGQDLRVFRPTVKEAPPSRAPRKSLPREVIAAPGEGTGRAADTRPPAPERPAAQQKSAAEPPASREPSEELLRRQHGEQRDFERRQADERSRLEKLQRQETQEARRLEPTTKAEELRRRHEEELRAHQEGVTREQKVLESKQAVQAETEEKKPEAATEQKKTATRKKTQQDRKPTQKKDQKEVPNEE